MMIEKIIRKLRVAIGGKRGAAPGDKSRPIANIQFFLEDLSARGFQPKGIIDVGAHRGDWTRMALKIFPNAQVIMIEPQEELKPTLTQFCLLHKNVEFLASGAGRQKGELVQTIWSDLAGSSFLPDTSEKRLADGTQRVTPVTTIDEILTERPRFTPGILKIDTQGFELEVLSGAKSLLGKAEIIILETSLYQFIRGMPVTFDCIKFMEENGYVLYDITEYLRRPLDGALGQVDLAFALRNGTLRRSHEWDSNHAPKPL
jgi:FkbM family methyltransferase